MLSLTKSNILSPTVQIKFERLWLYEASSLFLPQKN